jgi:hypothetical protein
MSGRYGVDCRFFALRCVVVVDGIVMSFASNLTCYFSMKVDKDRVLPD